MIPCTSECVYQSEGLCRLDSAAAAYDLGVTAMFSINREPRPLAESGPRSGENYRRTLEDIMRLIRAVVGR